MEPKEVPEEVSEKACAMRPLGSQKQPNLCCCYILEDDGTYKTPCHLPTDQCCHTERKRLVEELDRCGLCAECYEEFDQCYRDVPNESKRRAQSCIIA